MYKQAIAVPRDHPNFGSTAVFDTFRYSPAVSAGGLLFVAGQVGLRVDGTVPETAEEQAERAFERLGVVLEAGGAGFHDLVELVTYHVAIEQHLGAFRAVKDRYITGSFPTWTILGVAALARPNLLIEIRAIAALRPVSAG